MLSYYDKNAARIRHIAANACLTPLCALDGYHVTTVEGIGGMRQGMHPVQKRIASLHGSQCGFCTPGIVMSLYTILRENPNATPHEIEENMDGNLCRCTGYRPIIDAAKSLSNNKTPNEGCCGGAKNPSTCCRSNGSNGGCASGGCSAGGCGAAGGCPCKDGAVKYSNTEKLVDSLPSVSEELAANGTTEPIFPPALMKHTPSEFTLSSHGVTWHQPVTLPALLELKEQHPNAKLVVGNTEIGIETRFKNMEYSQLINPSHVMECKKIDVEKDGLRVGSCVTLNTLRDFIGAFLTSETMTCGRSLAAIRDMLTYFASNQIRNVACIGGNIVTASPISDMNPVLCSVNAVLTLISTKGQRTVPINDFFLAYRKVDMQPNEILLDVFIPFTSEFEYVVPLKQARRREDDISIVTAGMRFKLSPTPSQWIISECNLAFGGMAPLTISSKSAQVALANAPFTHETISAAYELIKKDMFLPENVPGGQADYRMTLAASFLYRSFVKISLELPKRSDLPPPPAITDDEVSAAEGFLTMPKPSTRGEQLYYEREGGMQKSEPAHAPTNESRTAVGKAVAHKSSTLQTTGEAIYSDDIAGPTGTLHASLVTSTKAHAKLININTEKASKCPGFVAFFCAKDVPGCNQTGGIIHDEEFFSTDEVKFYGAIIGIVVATSHEEAVYASKQVQVEYEDLPAVISIEEAIAAKSFFPDPFTVETGDIAQAKSVSDTVVEGCLRVGGQEHFYLETNAAIVIPLENGGLEVTSSTQNAAEVQMHVASACGIPASHVVSRVKRLGGGFGGKETRTAMFSCPAAIAAFLLQKPVKINIERDVDMQLSGQRHAFFIKYKAGCKADGSVTFLDAELYSNAGYSYDLSEPVMTRALFHVDNAYRWPNLRATGTLCRTNQPTHTAFRGFGAPQGMMVSETVLEHLSDVSKIPVQVLRGKNLYADGDRTHFGQLIEEYNVPQAWEDVLRLSEVASRQAAVDEFNRQHKWKKRGLCAMPTKYGINFTAKFMNQGGALVHIYLDGTVLVTHGGTEMGQGLFTKTIQVAANVFHIPHEMVHVNETATDKVPNASPTAGSMSTDLYGMAVLNACEQIEARLKPYREKNPTGTWKELITAAYFDRVNLSAQGFYVVPSERCGYDWRATNVKDNSERGCPFNYFTQGVACTEVEIDCLSGDSRIVRADILMDLGQSINPAIDIGQIEGAYVQGFGWCTMEELIWGDSQHTWVRTGQLFTRGPGTYKIPAFNDVPNDFRVHLMDKSNKYAVHSSKAVGEPPFFLSCSAFFAIRSAVKAARQTRGLNDYFVLNLPATSERIRMACSDDISNLITGNNLDYQAKGSW